MPTIARMAGASEKTTPAADAKAFADAYRALEREFPEACSPGNGTGSTPPTKAAVQQKVKAARTARSRTVNSDQLARGTALDDAVLTEVRTLIKNGEKDKALALGHALRGRPATRSTGCAVLGIALLNSSGPASAWTVFSEIAGTDDADLVANDLYAAAFGALGDDASEVLDADLASGRFHSWSGVTLLRVAQKALARGLSDQAEVLIRTAQGRPEASMTENVRKELARLASWLPGGSKRAEIPQVAGAIPFGVIGYDQPDIASRNIGDYIQTVASMGHLVRQQNFTFTGDPDLVELAEELRGSTKTERLVDGESVSLNLFQLNRDGSPLQAVPEGTWALTFGWFMHHMFGQGFAFPFHDNVRPIILSFHVRFPAMLTPEALDYLRRYSPVGCRDWQTVALLRSVGVPAFFSGCLTTTVDTVFRRDGEDTRDATVYVDSPQTGPGTSRMQEQMSVRSLTFVENLRLARDWVRDYHLKYDKVVTSRLHCFLPARSVGSQVTFLPKNRSNNRFGGLIDTSDADFERIRQGILDKASRILQVIASGADEDDVYARWREICAPAMAEADEFLAARELPVLTAEAVTALVPAQGSGEHGGSDPAAVHVVVDVRRGEAKHLPRLIRSIDAHTSAPVEILAVGATTTEGERQSLRSDDLPLPVRWITVDEVAVRSLGDVTPNRQHELSLALAAPALPHARHAVFLPASALVRDDLTRLATVLPEEGALVTATAERHRGRESGLELIRRISGRQGDDNARALDFLIAAHRRHPGEFSTFDTNVMVIDLEAARRANLAGHLLPLILKYGMSFGEAMNIYAGPHRTELDGVWNHAPGYEVRSDPGVVNWRDTSKPWSAWVTPFAEEWANY
ncbi:hypothetical protein GCM10022199_09050 [Marihabitans asiaticum]